VKYIITLEAKLEKELRAHLFQNDLEQGAFLFANVIMTTYKLNLQVVDSYFIPPEGWEFQLDLYLEMKDEERAKLMKHARDGNFAVIDCHSHPGSGGDVRFSPSDERGMQEFAIYAKWKLDGKPYAAMVWGESSADAFMWVEDFSQAHQVDEVNIIGSPMKLLTPRSRSPQGSKALQKRKPYGK